MLLLVSGTADHGMILHRPKNILLSSGRAAVRAGVLEVGVFCWPYKDLNEMLQRRKQSGSPP
jgi:hypothetical protein